MSESITNWIVEARKPGLPWFTWAMAPADNMIAKHQWRKTLPGNDHRGNLQFRLIRREAVITDTVLDELESS